MSIPRRTALFLACKTEERYYEAAQFAAMLQQGPDVAEDIVRLEPVLLEGLHFHMSVHHPFTPLRGLIIDVRVRQRRARRARQRA
jgi:hypothetical protein